MPHKLNFPSRFPIQHKSGMFVRSPSVSATDSTCVQGFIYLTHTNPTNTQTPNQAPRTLLPAELKSHPISPQNHNWGLKSTLHSWLWKRPHWFQCFSVTKSGSRWHVIPNRTYLYLHSDKLWRYRGFTHRVQNVTSFIFYLKIVGSANKPQLWCEYKKILPEFLT